MNTLVCDVCGCHYEACLSCKDKIALEPWKMHTDTAEHYKVYAVLLGYNTGVYDISEAYEKLQNIDLCDKDTYRVEGSHSWKPNDSVNCTFAYNIPSTNIIVNYHCTLETGTYKID